MPEDPFIADISRHIWDTKYRYREGNVIHDRSIADTWRRIDRRPHASTSIAMGPNQALRYHHHYRQENHGNQDENRQ